MTLEQIFKSTDWHKKWLVNNFSILGSSFIAQGYFSMTKRYNRGLLHNFFVLDHRTIICYQSDRENADIGKYIADKIKKNQSYASKLRKQALEKSEALRALMRLPAKRLFDPKNFQRFSKACSDLVPPFVAVIRCGNFLTEPDYADSLKLISKTRMDTESVLVEMDAYANQFVRLIAKKEKLKNTDLSVLTWKELGVYLKTGKLPAVKKLKSRTPVSGLVAIAGKNTFLNQNDTERLAFRIANKHKIKPGFAKGQTAYPGKAIGVARIIQDPKKRQTFHTGDILLTGMTRPDFVPLMKKASAVVTDAGGVLCHAAIVARELKKPCIIGTQTATLAFRSGDRAELDAAKGVIKKI